MPGAADTRFVAAPSISAPTRRRVWAISLIAAFAFLPAHARAQPAAARFDAAAVSRELDDLLRGHGDGITAAIWLGGERGTPWFEKDARQSFPTASAIKTFYLVELFDAHRGGLHRPLPAADAVLADDGHMAISHFTPDQRDEIRRELRGASVRRIGEVMMGRARVSNAVYNAAANLVTAVFGGPEALTERIRAREPAFAGVAVRRYMLRDRNVRGDNEAPADALAVLYQRLASRRLAGLDAPTADAVREAMVTQKDDSLGTSVAKDGALSSDPLTEVRAGWWTTARGPLVYVVMTRQPAPGPAGRERSSAQLGKTADALRDTLVRAGWRGLTAHDGAAPLK